MKYEFDKLTSIPEVLNLRDSFDLIDPNWHTAEARLRKLLMDKHGDEQALCLKHNFLPSYIKPGFVAASMLWSNPKATVNEIARIAEFVPRAYCEYNPLYRQIIPYVVGLTKDNKVFTMERIKGDDRLLGKISIGIGGHINQVDEGKDAIANGMLRELREEVDGLGKNLTVDFKGFLYDPSDGVGLDHVGFVFTLLMPDENISIKEKDTLRGYILTKEELLEKYDKMERWSQMVFDNLIR